MSPAPMNTAERERSEQAATWAVRMVDGAIPPEHEKEFVAWLDADSRNGDALEEIVGAWRCMEHYAANPKMVALREAALASARRTSRRPRTSGWPRSVVFGMLAATLLLMIGGVGAWVWFAPHVYETGVGERRVVALADGSKISLDAATTVKVSYSEHKRRLWLERGRAKFDVAKDHTRPFSVMAANKVVVATGTAFSVELVQRQVRVVLYEGKVALFDEGAGNAPPVIDAGANPVASAKRLTSSENMLKPGKQLILSEIVSRPEAPEAPVVAAADPVTSLSWEAGQLVFEDESLGVAVERMNRYAAKPLAIGDIAAANLRISGVFRAGDTEAFLQGLTATFDVQARNTPDGMTLFTGKRADPAR